MIIPDKKRVATIIVAKKLSDGGEVASEMNPEHSIGEHDEVLQGIAEDMIHAFNIRSAHAIVNAFRAMFEALEMKPHHEYGEEE